MNKWSDMLCSILIPTRNRPDKLVRLLSGLVLHSGPGDFELLARLDYDDPTLDESLKVLSSVQQCKCLIGHRGGGYEEIMSIWSELVPLATGKWIFMLGDDAVISGPWERQLASVEELNCLVEPETHLYRGQKHIYEDHSPFPIFPRTLLNILNRTDIPLDVILYKEVRENLGWPVAKLPLVTIDHDRLGDAEIIEERKQ